MAGSTSTGHRERGVRAVERTISEHRRMSQVRGRTRGALLVAGALLLSAPAGGAFAQVAPPHLDILKAEIRELPPLDPIDIGSRAVAIELTLAGPPVCTGTSPFTVYGVLIDADRDPNTGLADPAFDPLGVDARVSAECDQAAGQFVSEIGPVVIGTPGPGGETLLTISTTVGDLPAVEFDWFAFALEDSDLYRLPDAPGGARWAIHERSLW